MSGGKQLRSWMAIVASILAIGAVAWTLHAQESEESRRHGIFLDTVDVSLINVEVFVSRDGEPVTDLTRDDFEVLDDGQPVEITHLSRVVEGRRMLADGLPEDAESDTESESEDLGQREVSTIIVLVDQLFVSPLNRNLVFDRLTERLDGLARSGTRIMVASKARHLSIDQPFTSSRREVEMALSRLAEVATPDYHGEIELIAESWEMTPEAVESRQSGPGQPAPTMTTSVLDAQTAFQDANGLSRRIAADVDRSLTVLNRFVDSLAGLPGRKAIVYVADRLPTRPAELLWRIWWEKYGVEHGMRFGVTATGPAEFDASTTLEAMISDANASRVAFYPVGVESGPDVSGAGSRGLGSTTPASLRGGTMAAGSGIDWLAERTGGRAAMTSPSFDAFFDDLERDLGTYYSLAYRSPHGGDGEIHRLSVRVDRPDVEVRHMTEYRDKSSDQRLTDRTLAALTVGMEDNPLGVRTMVGKAKRMKKDLFTVPVRLEIPLANLVLLPGATTHRGKLSIQFIARHADASFSSPQVVRLPLEVKHADITWALSQTVDYEIGMTLRAGPQTLAIGVHDDLGFTGSTLRVEVEVGEGG